MARAKVTNEIDAIVFLNNASDFYKASERVFVPKQLLNKPLHFLYFHTLELAFKAYLRSHNVPTRELRRKGHNLVDLYADCRARGFVIGPTDQYDIGNVVNMLQGANEDQGLRYFNPETKSWPTLSWTREVVQNVIRKVEERLGVSADRIPGPATSIVFVYGKPVDNELHTS